MERHTGVDGGWELCTATPSPVLRGAIIGPYVGWTETRRDVVVRRETPSLLVPCIFSFGSPYSLRSDSQTATVMHDSFVAGVYDRWVDVGTPRDSIALQVNFTPLAAHRLFGGALHELTNAHVDVATLFGADGAALVSRLASQPDWGRRFALLDRFLVARWMRGVRLSRAVQWAWQQLALDAPAAVSRTTVMRVQDVGRALGWSPRRVSAVFREHTGLSSRRLQSVQRVGVATRLLREMPQVSLSAVAAMAGYADHAHLTRDVVAFTGFTPTMYRSALERGLQSPVAPMA